MPAGGQSQRTYERIADELPRARRRAESLARRAEEDPADLVEITLVELAVALEELTVATAHAAEEQAESERLRAEAGERARAGRELFDANPEAVMVSDANGVLSDVNAAACRLLRKPPEFLVGKPVAALVAEGHRRVLYDALEAVAGGRERVEVDLVLADGTESARRLVLARTGLGGERARHWQVKGAPPPPPTPSRTPPTQLDVGRQVAELTAELEAARALAAQLQRALDTRIVVEQAKGALAERHGWTPAEAWERLRSEARTSGSKVHDLAHAILRGEAEIG
jgi:PAS domain-containing protein